jgi:putative membrane protein
MTEEATDAVRRTRLANERTYLAWWRSALTAFAVAIGAGRIAPGLAGGTVWPYRVLGAAFGLLGVAFACCAVARHRSVERALNTGDYAPLDSRVAMVLGGATVVLGVATVALVVAGS